MTEADSTGDLLRETARRLFHAACDTATLRAADQGVWPAALWTAVEEAGLTKALLPESAGGFGVPVPDALSLLRVAAADAVPLPLAETMLAGWLLARAGIAVPDGSPSQGMASSGPLSVGPVRPEERATLVRQGETWTISGQLTRIPWARNATALAIVADCGGTPHVALVPSGAWTLEPGENVAREPRDTVHLTGAVVAAAPVPLTVEALFEAGAAIRTQQIAGALTRLTEMTVQYAQERVQFGRPIGKFQAVQQNLAVMAGQSAAAVAGADIAADAFADLASAAHPAGRPISAPSIAAGKARAGEAASIAASIAHQVHGAIGFTFEHNLHFLTRRLWSWRDEFGKDSYWTMELGRQMAAGGGDDLWANLTAA